ncbi:MAG: Flp pilus assembly complex ATPase component TadA [Thermoplasmatales archaeon]|nr:Flp pilus assembly complex ATPase component TadA [Thermoplasmatales archaeon]
MKIVPDTSIIIDGRLSEWIKSGKIQKVDIIIPNAVLKELERQANDGLEIGISGLNEIVELQKLSKEGKIYLYFQGSKEGNADEIIREVAETLHATLFTSDKIQAKVAEAKGINVYYLPSLHEEKELKILKYFDEETMSIHLRQDCRPVAKKGKPGNFRIVEVGEILSEKELAEIAHEIIEYAKRNSDSFVEIERKNATIVQIKNMRIAILRQPFVDKFEITATKPIVKLSIDDYSLDEELKERLTDYNRGILISGPPGSGKSTFAQAIAEHLYSLGAIVKTMENPRDLWVRDEIAQYAPLEKSMELTADILLLLRPDFVVFDEVRRSEDFKIYADMRLAGIGLIGVTHSNRAIDAIQRLIGRVELGIIPQVVDTVIHISSGKIKEVLELDFTVKIPHGMEEADLARPVIVVRDFYTKKAIYEIYTYGEQVTVMPVKERREENVENVERVVSKYIDSKFRVEINRKVANVYVNESEIPHIIGKGGKTISEIEREAGIKIRVHPLIEEEIIPDIIKRKKEIVIRVGKAFAGKELKIFIDGNVISARVGNNGEIKFKRNSIEGRKIVEAIASGNKISVKL